MEAAKSEKYPTFAPMSTKQSPRCSFSRMSATVSGSHSPCTRMVPWTWSIGSKNIQLFWTFVQHGGKSPARAAKRIRWRQEYLPALNGQIEAQVRCTTYNTRAGNLASILDNIIVGFTLLCFDLSDGGALSTFLAGPTTLAGTLHTGELCA